MWNNGYLVYFVHCTFISFCFVIIHWLFIGSWFISTHWKQILIVFTIFTGFYKLGFIKIFLHFYEFLFFLTRTIYFVRSGSRLSKLNNYSGISSFISWIETVASWTKNGRIISLRVQCFCFNVFNLIWTWSRYIFILWMYFSLFLWDKPSWIFLNNKFRFIRPWANRDRILRVLKPLLLAHHQLVLRLEIRVRFFESTLIFFIIICARCRILIRSHQSFPQNNHL